MSMYSEKVMDHFQNPRNVGEIESPDGIRQVASRCAGSPRFALDTEADSMHSYFHKVCLIQVSAGGRHFAGPVWRRVSGPRPGIPGLRPALPRCAGIRPGNRWLF